MLCRTPLLTAADLRDLTVAVRIRWVNTMDLRIRGLQNTHDILTAVVNVSDGFRILFDPLVFWGSSLRLSGASDVRVIMTPELHYAYLELLKTTVLDIASFNPEIQQSWIDFEAQRLQLVKTLEEAPAQDPELMAQVLPPAGTTPDFRN